MRLNEYKRYGPAYLQRLHDSFSDTGIRPLKNAPEPLSVVDSSSGAERRRLRLLDPGMDV